MRKVMLFLSSALAVGLSMNAVAQSQASQQGAPTVKTPIGFDSTVIAPFTG